MRYIVEVPVYLKVEVDSIDATDAISLAQRFVGTAAPVLASRSGDVLYAEIVPLDESEDDREPDVYVCRGGKLNQLGPGDLILPLDEDC